MFSTDLLDAKEEMLTQAYNMNAALHMRLDHLERQLLSLGANPYSRYDNISLASNVPITPSSTISSFKATTAMTTTTAATTASSVTTTSSCNNMQTSVIVSRASPSPSPQNGHRALTMTQSVPSQAIDPGRLTASFYEPRREFVSRRWSYYHHDRSRPGRRGGGGGQKPLREEAEAQKQQRQQQQQQQKQCQPQARGDHSPVRQQDGGNSNLPAGRGRGRSDYSPVRYQERGDYSPVRLQESGNRSPTGEGSLQRHGTSQSTRRQSLRRQDTVHQPPVSQPSLLQ